MNKDLLKLLKKNTQKTKKTEEKPKKIITDPNAGSIIEQDAGPLDGIQLTAAEMEELKRASKVDAVSSSIPSVRTRPEVQAVQCQCRICDEWFEVPPALARFPKKEEGDEKPFNPFVCNRCSSGG